MTYQDVPLVPSIWPLGHGCVLTSFAMAEGVPMFFLRAVTDSHIGKPGDLGSPELWDDLSDAPTLTLTFADLAALDRHIASLQELASAVRDQATPA